MNYRARNRAYLDRTAIVALPVGMMVRSAQLAAARGESSTNRCQVIDRCREKGPDIVELIAVRLAISIVRRLGIRPRPGALYTFSISDEHDLDLTDDQMDPGLQARARMVTAIANADALAARDVFLAYARANPEDVSMFLVALADAAAGVNEHDGAQTVSMAGPIRPRLTAFLLALLTLGLVAMFTAMIFFGLQILTEVTP